MRPALIYGGTIKIMALEIFGKLAIAWGTSITSRALLADIDAAAITAYVVERRSMSKASGTINIALATLKRPSMLAHDYGKLGNASKQDDKA